MKGLLRIWTSLFRYSGYSKTLSDDPAPQTHQQSEKYHGDGDAGETGFGKRHNLILLLFFGFSCIYAMRVNLSVAIVAMVKTRPKSKELHSLSDECPAPLPPPREDEQSPWESESAGEFDWDEQSQGLVLGSFFYGYLLTNYLGGRLADRFGGRRIYGAGITLTAVLTLLSPVAARHSTGAFVLTRMLVGMAEGVTFPSMNMLVSYWIPPQERARSLTRIIGGCHVGTVVTLSLSGWFIQSEWGWPSVFYVYGALSLVWSWFWFRHTYDSPDQHPTITAAEKCYIKQGIGDHRGKMGLEVPWHSILTSVPFLVVVVSHIGHNWGFYCLLTELPTYLKNVQHFDMKQNGLLSALPYLVQWVFSLIYSSYMDRLLKEDRLSTVQVRKLSMVIANYFPMVSLVLMSWVGCDRWLAVVLICVTVGTTGASLCGMHCAFQELAPNFAGTLTGISNTLATIPGFLAPAVTGTIINNQQTLSRWSEVFHLASFVYFVAGTMYLVFISVETQPWNDTNAEKRRDLLKDNAELKTV